jgi:hypothetical protein
MSTKFEQLLDYLVNEEMDKANELFHDIVVEKSREIYENLIAEEAEEEEMDESSCDDEEMGESTEELEDSYEMSSEAEEDDAEADDDFGGDETDDSLDDVEMDGSDEFGSDDDTGGEEGDESQAIFDIKNAIAELEAAFADLEASQGADGADDFGDAEFGDEESDDEFGDEESDSEFGDEEFGDEEETDEMMGMYEGRRMTREYREKVGNDWDKNSQKTQGQIVGANSGEKMPGSDEGRSPISSGKGKPTTGASADNILGKSATAAEDGTKPHGKVGGLVKGGGKFTGNGTHNVDNVKSGVKTLSKQGSGYPGNNKSSGPVGSGSGDKAGQTSVAPETKKQFLPPHTK